MKTLIVRNDKLGDFVLTLPCYALLKSALPDTHIAVFVPDYTAEIARCCPYIDQVIIDPGDGSLSGIYKLAQHLHSFKFDAHLYSSGVYFYVIQSGNSMTTKKMLLIK